ncbi:hypothetical protein ACJJTC_014956 [Scirpophaga incertulas]
MGIPKDCTFVMNRGISTPYDCARHLSEWHMDSSALAVIDGTNYWDMHRPLHDNCTLELQTFTSEQPQQVNKAYWRTCSFLLGACALTAFKDSVPVILHSFPGPEIHSGSFVYDIDLPSLPDWQPSKQELMTLAAEYVKICRRNLLIERLEVSEELAKEMFIDNKYKHKQIPDIARNNVNGKVVLYRAGQHVDISKGPMVSSTGQVGRVNIASIHKLEGSINGEESHLYRFQGVSLPRSIMLNHFAYNILVDRAKKLNRARLPTKQSAQEESIPDQETQTLAAQA